MRYVIPAALAIMAAVDFFSSQDFKTENKMDITFCTDYTS